jgi:hypothetical protein
MTMTQFSRTVLQGGSVVVLSLGSIDGVSVQSEQAIQDGAVSEDGKNWYVVVVFRRRQQRQESKASLQFADSIRTCICFGYH